MTLVNLFLGFLKVGCFAFGGAYGAIPLIRDVVLSYGWLSEESLMAMIAISESTPGPIMVNLATYVGSSQAGLAGAVLATLAVVFPSFIIVLLITAALQTLLKHKMIQSILQGLKPCVIGIVLATGVIMVLKNFLFLHDSLAVKPKEFLITLLLLGLLICSKRFWKKKISPILLIVIAAGLGILFY